MTPRKISVMKMMVVVVVCMVTSPVEGKSALMTEDTPDIQLTEGNPDIQLTEGSSVDAADQTSESQEITEPEHGSEARALEDSISSVVEEIMASRRRRSSSSGLKRKQHNTNKKHLKTRLREVILRNARHELEGFYHIPPSRLQLNEDEPGFFYVPPRTD